MVKLNNSFPDDSLSNKKKHDFDFGEQVAKAIEGQWFQGALNSRRVWIDLMRSFSRGEQDPTPYKETLEGVSNKEQGDGFSVKTHKIDYKTLKILPNFRHIVINPIDESQFKPRAEAIDILSVNKKKDYFEKLNKDFYTREFKQIIQQNTGLQMINPDDPTTLEELNIKKLEFKPNIEIAQELAIENVLKLERFENTKKLINGDIFDLGVGVGRHYTDFSEGIKPKYVDPYNWVHSDFQNEDGSDIRYHGVMVKGTIADLIKEAGRTLETKELDEIKRYSLGKDGDNSIVFNYSEDSGRTLEWLSFAYITSKERVFKKLRKNKTIKAVDRSDDGYNPNNKNKRISIPYNTWFEGVYVPGVEILVNWREIPNQVTDDIGFPICPFIVYAPNVKRSSERGSVRFDSMVERAIPFVDDIHRDWFKFQQLKMELRPSTIEIDTDAINNVSLNGQVVPANLLLNLYFGRGLLLKNRFNNDGDEIDRAIQESDSSGSYNTLQFLSNEFGNNYNRLRQILGINEVRDGSTTPNSRTAVGVQKILYASSNTATNHIVNASFNISLQFCAGISARLYDIMDSKELTNRYIDSIGTEYVDVLMALKEHPMAKFAIYFDFRPDNDERITLEQSLLVSYESREINVAQYNKARQIRNVKSAIKYLEFIVEENHKKREQEKLMGIQAQAEANAQSAVIAEQTRQQTLTVEWQTKEQEMLLKAQIDEQKMRAKAAIDDLMASKKHERDLELKSMELQIKRSVEEFKEDRKDERVNLQDTNESKKIFQRKNNTDPIDFQDQLDDIFNDLNIQQ